MPDSELHPAQLPLDMLLAKCEFKRTRASGPGGQHRNKVETAVVATHAPSGIKGQASERRSQDANREVAIFRLRLNLALQLRTPPASKPSDLWQARSRGGKIAINSQHADFPAILAEALNVIEECEYDVQEASQKLGISTSQLLKLLKIDSDAMRYCNQQRHNRGLFRLK